MLLIFLMIVWIIFYTPIANKILFPNGKKTFKIIYNLAKDEFGDEVKECKDYLGLNKAIIKRLKKLKEQEFEEYELGTVVNIEHIKQNDFGNHMALKFSYWAIILASVSIIDISSVFSFFEMYIVMLKSLDFTVFPQDSKLNLLPIYYF